MLKAHSAHTYLILAKLLTYATNLSGRDWRRRSTRGSVAKKNKSQTRSEHEPYTLAHTKSTHVSKSRSVEGHFEVAEGGVPISEAAGLLK